MSKVYFGIDVSEHNGTVNWVKVAQEVDFAILRIGWVGNKNNHTLDKKFNENYAAAKKAGIKLGAYVYMYSATTAAAKSGAEWAVQQLKDKSFELPIYCDMEDNSIAGLGKATLTAITKEFNNIIEGKGYWAGVYANKNWFDNYLEKSIPERYTSWIAHYTSGTNKYQGEFDMWQNSSKGKIDGIKGNVDTNYLYRDLFSEIGKKAKSTSDTKTNKPSYKKGQTLTLIKNLNVRTGAGTNYTQKKKYQLTADGQKNALNQTYAVLKKGTKVTIQEIKTVGDDIWLRIPSGWVAAYYKGEVFIK